MTYRGMMLLVALMILWQYRTLSHPLRHQRQTLGSMSFSIFGTDPLAHSICSTWCFSARRTNWLQQLGLKPSVSLPASLSVSVCSLSLSLFHSLSVWPMLFNGINLIIGIKRVEVTISNHIQKALSIIAPFWCKQRFK